MGARSKAQLRHLLCSGNPPRGAAPQPDHIHERLARADMRHLHARNRLDVLLAWDSFFHLDSVPQARILRIFAAHAAPGAVLVFSNGPARGQAYCRAAGRPVYHASHDPLVYRLMLRRAGSATILFRPEDPQVDRHSWWLCRKLD
jgi:hypothetical protein